MQLVLVKRFETQDNLHEDVQDDVTIEIIIEQFM
jgi:hypothetical protein